MTRELTHYGLFSNSDAHVSITDLTFILIDEYDNVLNCGRGFGFGDFENLDIARNCGQINMADAAAVRF